MRKFLRKIERHGDQGVHVDQFGDLRDRYGVLIRDPKSVSSAKRRRKAAQLSTFEGLPTEIKVLILRKCDVSSLKALVHASSSCHAAYSSQRRATLEAAMIETIGTGGLWEAQKVLEARKLHGAPEDFLVSYHDMRLRGQFPYRMQALDSLIPLANLQLMLERIARRYCDNVLSEHPVDGTKLRGYRGPTGTELRRIMRGLTRFELLCKVFGGRRNAPVPVAGISRLFLAPFTMWEVEEIACIGKYILDQYDETLRYGSIDSTQRPKSRSDMALYTARLNEKKEFAMSLGLERFARFITSTPGAQLTQLNSLARPPGDESALARALDRHHASQQRSHRAQGIDPEMFADVRFVNEGTGPNVGFLWSKGAKPWDFDEINNGHRDWGYVFWDRWRLRGWGVLRMNRRTWKRGKRSMSR